MAMWAKDSDLTVYCKGGTSKPNGYTDSADRTMPTRPSACLLRLAVSTTWGQFGDIYQNQVCTRSWAQKFHF